MREHPWNVRRVGHRHLHDHRNLLDLHFLTHAWQPTDSEASTPNPFSTEPSLEDDTWPEDVLGRIEHEVHRAQLSAMARQLRGSAGHPAARLDERSFEAGRECSSRRWPQASEQLKRHLGAAASACPARPDQRTILTALFHSPLAGRLGAGAFLVRRALVTEIAVELLHCPHREPSSEGVSEAVLDAVCDQRFHWLRGYLHHLDPAARPAISRTQGRCVVSWTGA